MFCYQTHMERMWAAQLSILFVYYQHLRLFRKLDFWLQEMRLELHFSGQKQLRSQRQFVLDLLLVWLHRKSWHLLSVSCSEPPEATCSSRAPVLVKSQTQTPQRSKRSLYLLSSLLENVHESRSWRWVLRSAISLNSVLLNTPLSSHILA